MGIKKVIHREIQRMLSRQIYLVAIVIIPLISYFFFMTLFSEGLPKDLPVAVIDNDNTSSSRDFIRQIDIMQMARVSMQLNSFTEAETEMKKGHIFAFVIIPENFQADVMASRQPKLTFYYNNAFFIPGSLLMRDLNTISGLSSASVALSAGLAKGQTEAGLMGQLQPIVLDAHLIGNPYTNYSVYLSNVLMPGILQLMIMLMTVFAIGLELKERTGRQWLRMADMSIVKALTGKLLPYTIVFTVMVIFQNILLFRISQFPLHSNILTMIIASIFFVLATQAIGIVLIGILPVLRIGMSCAAVIGILGISFSGFTFPIEHMPVFIQSIAQLFPMRHFFEIYQNSALNGAPLNYYWYSYLYLLITILVPFIILYRLKQALIHQNYAVR
ncbi:MAG: ABC transporter permease [Prevotellaceae bacterium]|jgi:ABC-2 type transport system permease protein|nr:ABC transporter permease [Prevotellaceae bacterium]